MPEPRPIAAGHAATVAMPADVQIDGEWRPCCRHRTSKRVYESLDVAWAKAFCVFAQTGNILTPYLCGRSRTYTSTVHLRGCGNWYLTSYPKNVLPSADGLWNKAGNYAGPRRECLRSDGLAKKIFASQSAAQDAIRKGGGGRKYEPYECRLHHWHMGRKVTRPVIDQRD